MGVKEYNEEFELPGGDYTEFISEGVEFKITNNTDKKKKVRIEIK